MDIETGPRFATREPVDFVIVGSGAAGGVLARELAVAGFEVVVLEQGPYRRSGDFNHDEFGVFFRNELMGGVAGDDPQTFRAIAEETAKVQISPPPAMYARTVGGSSTHFSANYWRFREVDFNEASRLGTIEGTGFADWPLSYAELEPYYSRVDWEIGVSGAPGPTDAPRSKPFPLPPMPLKSSGALLDQGAAALGLTTQAAPLAILSQPYRGRSPCIHCGFCLAFGCEAGAKSSTLVTMIPEAEATGRCEIRAQCTVVRLETGPDGKVREVVYRDPDGQEQAQRARAVILAANGAESPRLLLMSESASAPQGMANANGLVGKYLMFNGHTVANGWFEEPLNEYKSVQCTRVIFDFYENDPARGFYGGGGIDARPLTNSFPIFFALQGMPPEAPGWGAEYKKLVTRYFTRNMSLLGSTTSLAQESNSITLDPEHRDRYGRPGVRVTYRDHQDDLAMGRFLQDRNVELLEAAGASRVWRDPVQPQTFGAHLLGTCRMGNDPATSVVDRFHRSHEVANLFICDGSSFVTSGRGQPTMTIQALAFRAAEHIARFAREGQV